MLLLPKVLQLLKDTLRSDKVFQTYYNTTVETVIY